MFKRISQEDSVEIKQMLAQGAEYTVPPLEPKSSFEHLAQRLKTQFKLEDLTSFLAVKESRDYMRFLLPYLRTRPVGEGYKMTSKKYSQNDFDGLCKRMRDIAELLHIRDELNGRVIHPPAAVAE
jgi:hypothetical protein